MGSSRLLISEEERKYPVLLIDKQGSVGAALAYKLLPGFLVIIVSQTIPEVLSEQVVHIPFGKKIPRIPDNSFSHIFIVYDKEKLTNAIIPSLIEKANEAGSVVVFLVSLPDLSDKLLGRIHQYAPSAKVVVVGDIFGSPAFASLATSLLQEAGRGSIILRESGLRKFYPVHIADTADAILAATFGQHISKKNLFFALPKYPVTELSFVRLLRQRYPLLKIDFAKYSRGESGGVRLPDGTYVLSDPYPLGKRLNEIDLSENSQEAVVQKKPKENPSSFHLRRFFAIGFLLFSILLFPLLFFAGIGLVAGAFLAQSVTALEKGDLIKAQESLRISRQSFFIGEQAAEMVAPAADLVRAGEMLGIIETNFHTGVLTTDAAGSALKALVLYQTVLLQESPRPKADFQSAIQESKNALILLSQLRAEKRMPSFYAKKLEEYDRVFALFLATADVLPQLLGFEGEKTYLVLFQNNMELRPGGGFIGSYGLLTLKNAMTQSFVVHDVYEADGKLKGHIEPPFLLKRYLGASHLFLRDTNVSADFPSNARQAAYFLSLETNQRVDGVMAVDVSFIRNLLRVLGPVQLPEYKKRVSADTFFPLVENEAQSDFFPGSNQKRDVLTAVYTSLNAALFEKGKTPPPALPGSIRYPALLAALAVGIEEKHVLFAFPDEKLQRVFTVNNLSGSLADDRSENLDRINDFFALSEANLGMNKANYSIQRAIEQTVQIGADGRITESTRVSFAHNGKGESGFGGDYKNYFRLVLPPAASLAEVFLDGQSQTLVPAVTDPKVYGAKRFVAPSGLEVETGEEEGKSVFGFLVIVPSGSHKTVALSYQLAKSLPLTESEFVYSLRVLKQPGTEQDPYVLTLSYPETYRVVDKSDGLISQGDNLVYSTLLSKDREISVRFAKK